MTSLAALLAALAGTPLFAVIAGIALFAYSRAGIDPMAVAIEMARLADTPMLEALPLFIFTGLLLAESGSPARLLAVTRALCGRLPGAMAVVAVVLCALFTALTGATGVTIVALGPLLYPALADDGYPERLRLGLLTVSGSLGLLLPPSLPLILYGVVAGVRIDRLFAAGLLPNLLILIVICAYAAWRAPRTLSSRHRPPVGKALRQALWELPLPFIVLGGIYGGFLVVSEAAVVAALYAIVVEVGVYRDVPLTRLPGLAVRSMILFGAIIAVLAASLAFTSYLVDRQIPERIFDLLTGWINTRAGFLLALNLFLLGVGAVLDIFSAIVLVAPLIVPVAARFGIEPLHLAVIFLVNLQIGYATPPVGLNLFLASHQFGQPVLRTALATLPFVLLLLAVLALVTAFPGLFLP